MDAELAAKLGPLEASIRAGFDSMRSEVSKIRQNVDAMRARVPADVRLSASGVIPNPTARSVLNLGGPATGFYWKVRRLVIGGVTWTTDASGTAEVYVSAMGPPVNSGFATGAIPAALSLVDLVEQASSLPFRAYYSNEQIIVNERENLLVLFDSGTESQQYVAAAQVRAFRHVTTGESYNA